MKLTTGFANGIFHVQLNRPEQKNAVDFDVIRELSEALYEAESNQNIHTFFLTGHPGAFCSGGDVQAFHSLRTKEEALTMLRPMNDNLIRLRKLPCVTACFIDGPAVGGGAELAAACDRIYISSKGKAGFIQGKLALSTGWGGAACLKEKVGAKHAFHMLATASVYGSDRLLETGYADAKAENIEEVLADLLPVTVPGEALKSYREPLDASLFYKEMAFEADRCAALWESDEHHKQVELFLNRK
ncbi:enoyl-CoA hydratase/isomerase family protein [Alkalicoccus luteus]|uniref:Enoyl-CoA hydratase/isomerase family protein n=1 Tax=Alkalicoccus luteus TaxID=1237094 RepID=A0A969TVK7_9BACI|nr:enoyl-CoA hydratase/isomerase family protein [Alkalicoccus luteus]NJP36459.1 enoyl-CoA hydratase/isomerase family protein [Alkalicoccus luteus]